jgi:hypothetical protein
MMAPPVQLKRQQRLVQEQHTGGVGCKFLSRKSIGLPTGSYVIPESKKIPVNTSVEDGAFAVFANEEQLKKLRKENEELVRDRDDLIDDHAVALEDLEKLSSDYDQLKKGFAKFREETKTLLEEMDELREEARLAKDVNNYLQYIKSEAKYKIAKVMREKIDAELRAKDLSFLLDSAQDHMSIMAQEKKTVQVEVMSLRQRLSKCSCNEQESESKRSICGKHGGKGALVVKNPFARRNALNASSCDNIDRTTEVRPLRRLKKTQSARCAMQMVSVSNDHPSYAKVSVSVVEVRHRTT